MFCGISKNVATCKSAFRELYQSITAPNPNTHSTNEVHWLLRTPVSFFRWYCGISSFPKDEYTVLGIRIWFFVGDNIQLLHIDHSGAGVNVADQPSTPLQWIDFRNDASGNLRTTMMRPDKSFRDMVLDMLEPGIRDGKLKNAQFLDFAYPKPVVVEQFGTSSSLTVEINLSLEPNSPPPLGALTIMHPDGETRHWQVRKPPFSYAETSRRMKEHELFHGMSQTLIDAAFKRMKACRKIIILPKLDIHELEKYCENALSCVLAARQKEGAGKTKTQCGYLTARKENQRVFVFQTEQSVSGQPRILLHDGRDFRVLGFFRKGSVVSLVRPVAREVLEAMIAEDGRVKVSWRVMGEETGILGREVERDWALV